MRSYLALLLLQLEVVLPRIRIRECDPRPRHVIQAPASEVVVASIHYSSHECKHIHEQVWVASPVTPVKITRQTCVARQHTSVVLF